MRRTNGANSPCLLASRRLELLPCGWVLHHLVGEDTFAVWLSFITDTFHKALDKTYSGPVSFSLDAPLLYPTATVPLPSDFLTAPCVTRRCLGQVRQPCPAAVPSGWAGLALLRSLQARDGREGPRRTGQGILCATGAEMPCGTDVITRQTKAGRLHLYQKNTEERQRVTERLSTKGTQEPVLQVCCH